MPRLKRANSLRNLACFVVLLLLSSVASAQQPGSSTVYTQFVKSTTLSVFSDGSAEVNQTLLLPQNLTAVSFPLFSKQVGNILAVNQAGSPISYQISGGNITLYTLGATRVSLAYETNALTSKQGTVWNLSFNTPFNMSLILPLQSTILSSSGVPNSIAIGGDGPVLVLLAGAWEIGYGLPLGVSISTRTTTGATPSNPTPLTPLTSPTGQAAILTAVAVVGSAAAFLMRGKMRGDGVGRVLRFDDKEILRFIKEKGGRAIETEIRERFSLPRTSAWRQARRLEKLGYVKISKLGVQNQVELLRADFEQPL